MPVVPYMPAVNHFGVHFRPIDGGAAIYRGQTIFRNDSGLSCPHVRIATGGQALQRQCQYQSMFWLVYHQ